MKIPNFLAKEKYRLAHQILPRIGMDTVVNEIFNL